MLPGLRQQPFSLGSALSTRLSFPFVFRPVAFASETFLFPLVTSVPLTVHLLRFAQTPSGLLRSTWRALRLGWVASLRRAAVSTPSASRPLGHVAFITVFLSHRLR
jgi:hypothetical protein